MILQPDRQIILAESGSSFSVEGPCGPTERVNTQGSSAFRGASNEAAQYPTDSVHRGDDVSPTFGVIPGMEIPSAFPNAAQPAADFAVPRTGTVLAPPATVVGGMRVVAERFKIERFRNVRDATGRPAGGYVPKLVSKTDVSQVRLSVSYGTLLPRERTFGLCEGLDR